jgi:FAD binding domain
MAGYQDAIHYWVTTIYPYGCAPVRTEHNVDVIAQTTTCGCLDVWRTIFAAVFLSISKACVFVFAANYPGETKRRRADKYVNQLSSRPDPAGAAASSCGRRRGSGSVRHRIHRLGTAPPMGNNAAQRIPRSARDVHVPGTLGAGVAQRPPSPGRRRRPPDAAVRRPGMCSGLRDAMNLYWKLDLVLGGADDTLLDTYGPERSGHVRGFISFSMELGNLICATDPEAVRTRDARMKAAAAAASQPPPRPLPRLGPDLHTGQECAGALAPQGVVRGQDAKGLLDDVIGPGGALIGPAAALGDVTRPTCRAGRPRHPRRRVRRDAQRGHRRRCRRRLCLLARRLRGAGRPCASGFLRLRRRHRGPDGSRSRRAVPSLPAVSPRRHPTHSRKERYGPWRPMS